MSDTLNAIATAIIAGLGPTGYVTAVNAMHDLTGGPA